MELQAIFEILADQVEPGIARSVASRLLKGGIATVSGIADIPEIFSNFIQYYKYQQFQGLTPEEGQFAVANGYAKTVQLPSVLFSKPYDFSAYISADLNQLTEVSVLLQPLSEEVIVNSVEWMPAFFSFCIQLNAKGIETPLDSVLLMKSGSRRNTALIKFSKSELCSIGKRIQFFSEEFSTFELSNIALLISVVGITAIYKIYSDNMSRARTRQLSVDYSVLVSQYPGAPADAVIPSGWRVATALELLVAGRLTGCCQTVGDQGGSTIQFTLENPTEAYELFQLDKKDSIIASSWIVKGSDGVWTQNSYESFSVKDNSAECFSFQCAVHGIRGYSEWYNIPQKQRPYRKDGKGVYSDLGMFKL